MLVAPVEPPAPVWDKIKAGARRRGTGRADAAARSCRRRRWPRAEGPSAEIIDLTQRMRRWRGLTVMTGALAACDRRHRAGARISPRCAAARLAPEAAGGRAGGGEAGRGGARGRARGAVGAAGAVRRGVPEGRAVAGLPDVGRHRQAHRHGAPGRGRAARRQVLSIVDRDRSRTRRRSRSACSSSDDFTVRATLAAYDPAVINNATFGISLEPLGGSPTGQPTAR